MGYGQGCQANLPFIGEYGGLTAQSVGTSSDVIHYVVSVPVPTCIVGTRWNAGGTSSPIQFGLADMKGNILLSTGTSLSGSGLSSLSMNVPVCVPAGMYLKYIQPSSTVITLGTFNAGGTNMPGVARFATSTFPITGSFTPNGSGAVSKGLSFMFLTAGGTTF